MMSQASHSQDRFATTRWSMVLQVADGGSASARNALDELAIRYQYPVYAYVRHLGRTPRSAARLTRALLRCLHEEDPARIPASDYRRFLFERLHALIDDENSSPGEPGADEIAAAVQLEQRYLRDHAASASPQQVFQRSFALVVLQRSRERLRSEAESTGHADMFDALEPYLVRDPPAADLERVTQRLRLRRVTLLLALKRLRQRLRELASEELADTVHTPEDLSREQEALLAAIAEQQSR